MRIFLEGDDEGERLRLFWFRVEETGFETEMFFRGDIKERVKMLQQLGFEVIDLTYEGLI